MAATDLISPEILPLPVDTRFQRVYGAGDSARLAGISYRQIDHWERMGVLTPSVHQAHGSGDRRQYNVDDVHVLAVLGELTRLGARIPNLAAAAPAIRDALHREPRWLLVTPESFVETCSHDTVTLCMEMNGVSGAWMVDIQAVIARVKV